MAAATAAGAIGLIQVVIPAAIWSSLAATLLTGLLAAGLTLFLLRQPLAALREATQFAGRLLREPGGKLPPSAGAAEVRELVEALNEVSVWLYSKDLTLTAASERITKTPVRTYPAQPGFTRPREGFGPVAKAGA